MDQKGNLGLVWVRRRGGEAADMACGRENWFIDVNGVGIFGGLIQSPSEKTEVISPVSLVLYKTVTSQTLKLKRYLGIFCKAS